MTPNTGSAPLTRFNYATTAARDAATLVATDIGSRCLVQADGSKYLCTAVTVLGVPTWVAWNDSMQAELSGMIEDIRSLAYAVDHCGWARFTAPIAADLVSTVAAADMANGAATIIANKIDYPRKLQVRVVDANSSTTAGIVTLVGVDQDGFAVTETVALTGGTATTKTKYAYSSLTSATISALVGAAAGDTLGIGAGTALGLPRTSRSVLKTTLNVYKSNVNNVNEAVGTIDSTARTIEPTSAPDASKSFDFWYNFT